ncbi:MAG TPA: acyl carrier protein [Pseudonocardiaceae bacterium]|nr:acyl carrier protein [Pseudonocardiaceae bacterium]
MPTFTVDDLAEIMHEGAGEAEPIDWQGSALTTTFEDLGYDSVALLETAGRVHQQFGVQIEDELPELKTPAEFIEHVNELAGE